MPRPKLTPDVLRSRRVSVYLSPVELAELRRRAEAAQMSLPVYLRERALRSRAPSTDPRRLGANEFRQLAGLCGNINQIAHALNSGKRAPVFTRAELLELRTLVSLVMPEAKG